MKRKKASFTGSRPIFTGSPSIVPGGFNLDVANQSFKVGDTIPQGTVAKFDEQTRLVQILKTAEVVDVDTDDNKIVSLRVAEFFEPCFVVGDKVAKADAISGTFADAAAIVKIDRTKTTYVVTLDKAVTGLAQGDTLEEVVSKASDEIVAGIMVTHGDSDHVYVVTPGLDIAAGDKVMNYPLANGALIANAIAVTSYDKLTGKLVLASDPTSAAVGDKVAVVFADATDETKAATSQGIAAERFTGGSLTIKDVDVDEFETAIDVTADTMQYALLERRVPPIPSSQKDATGMFLKGNPHIKLSKSF
jgi:hypothetical protein